jgi:NifB/MoaA-like Fe-S oxidoreductase
MKTSTSAIAFAVSPSEIGLTRNYQFNTNRVQKLEKNQILWLKQFIGTFLCNARAVDPTILVAINKLAPQHANDKTKELDDHLNHLKQFLTPDSIVEISGKTIYKEFVSFHQLLKDKLKIKMIEI